MISPFNPSEIVDKSIDIDKQAAATMHDEYVQAKNKTNKKSRQNAVVACNWMYEFTLGSIPFWNSFFGFVRARAREKNNWRCIWTVCTSCIPCDRFMHKMYNPLSSKREREKLVFFLYFHVTAWRWCVCVIPPTLCSIVIVRLITSTASLIVDVQKSIKRKRVNKKKTKSVTENLPENLWLITLQKRQYQNAIYFASLICALRSFIRSFASHRFGNGT